MSIELRDHFAMAALTGIISNHSVTMTNRNEPWPDIYAEWAYLYAAAMVKAREVGHE